MTHRLTSAATVAALLLLLTACSDHDPNIACDADGLARALSEARPGQTVTLEECTLGGQFTIPEGVTLRGAGVGTVLVSDFGVGLVLETGPAGVTAVRDLTVRSAGRVGILARGDGEVLVQDVTVSAERGYALGVEGASTLTMTDVALTGPVTVDNRESAGLVTPDSSTSATYGLVLLDVDRADLANVSIAGFSYFGAAVLDATSDGTATAGTALAWNGGGVTDTLGVGLYVSGGSAALTDLDLSRSWRGLRGAPSYAAIFTGGVAVTTRGLRVTDNDNYGILHEGGTADHEGVAVTGNGLGGVLADAPDDLMVRGGSTVDDNGAVGLFVLGAQRVTVRETAVSNTRLTPSNLRAGAIGDSIMLGDGLAIIGSTVSAVFEDVTASDNERLGILVDLGATAPSFATVVVSGTGAQLGVVGGNTDDPVAPTQMTPVAPDGVWDSGITRMGDVAANDAALTDVMEIAGIVTPSMLPRPSDAAGIVTPSM